MLFLPDLVHVQTSVCGKALKRLTLSSIHYSVSLIAAHEDLDCFLLLHACAL